MARGLIKQSKCTSNCGARRQEGRRNRGDGWCLVLSEWTNWSRMGEGEKTCPLGNHKTPPLVYSPPPTKPAPRLPTAWVHSHEVPSAFMWLLVLHSEALKLCLWELLWLFGLFIRIICCPSRPVFSHLLSRALTWCWTFFLEHKNFKNPVLHSLK